jgi:hypothetical protein
MGEALRKKWPMVERDQRISEVVPRKQPGAPQHDSEARALHKIDPSCGINGVGRHLNARLGGNSADAAPEKTFRGGSDLVFHNVGLLSFRELRPRDLKCVTAVKGRCPDGVTRT